MSESHAIKVTKKIKFSNTTQVAIQFYNLQHKSTIFYDDVSLRKNNDNSDCNLKKYNF